MRFSSYNYPGFFPTQPCPQFHLYSKLNLSPLLKSSAMPFEPKFFRGLPTGAIVESVNRRPNLFQDEVAIEVTHSGVCGTDEHFKYAPIGLGHEGIGVAKAVGPDVANLKVSNYPSLMWRDGPTDILATETESAWDT